MEVLALISTLGLTWSRIRLAFVGISVTLAATACGSAAVQPPPDGPLVQQLAGEVSDARAVKHLQALQKIADENDGNRAAGTPGYDASVEYVVDVLRDAGFKPSTPAYEASGEDSRRGRDRAQCHRPNPHRRPRPGRDDRRPPGLGRGRPGHRRQRLRRGDPAGDRHPARRRPVGAEHGPVWVLRRRGERP